jgi:hypothetical protein
MPTASSTNASTPTTHHTVPVKAAPDAACRGSARPKPVSPLAPAIHYAPATSLASTNGHISALAP